MTASKSEIRVAARAIRDLEKQGPASYSEMAQAALGALESHWRKSSAGEMRGFFRQLTSEQQASALKNEHD